MESKISVSAIISVPVSSEAPSAEDVLNAIAAVDGLGENAMINVVVNKVESQNASNLSSAE